MLAISSISNNIRSGEIYIFLRKLKEEIVTFLQRLFLLRMTQSNAVKFVLSDAFRKSQNQQYV